MSHALICKCISTVFVYVNETQYMCIDFDGHHSGGSSFVCVVSEILIRLLKKKGKESQYIVSCPETWFGSANRVGPGIEV